MSQLFSSLECGSCQYLTHALMLMQCFIQGRVNLQKKSPVVLINKFQILVVARMLQRLTIHFLRHYLSNGRLQEVKNNGKFQTLSSQIGRGRLREVVAYKMFQISGLTWKLLVFYKSDR